MYPNRAHEVPRLLVEIEPWGRVFFRNLRDLFRRQPPALDTGTRPGRFWPDVFVHTGAPRRTLTASAIFHLALVELLYLLPMYLLLSRPVLHPQNSQDHLTYADIGEYLPPVNTGAAPARIARKGQPAYAKQPIISTPDDPDNLRQTIIDPDHPVKLNVEVKMPNVVIWTERPAPPVAASAGQSRLTFPRLPSPVVAPAPEATTTGRLNLPRMPAAAVVEPPPPDAAQRSVAQLNIGHFDSTVAAPALPVPEQAAGGIEDTARMAALAHAAPGGSVDPPAVPAAPSASASSGGSGLQAAGRLIALGVDPAGVSGPIPVPGGNRRGEFAAGPSGTPGAPGTPDIAGGGNGPGGTGSGARGGLGNGNGGIPAGIYVGAGPAGAPTSGVAATTPPSGGGGKAAGVPGTRQVLMAAMSRPKITDVPRDVTPPSTPVAPSEVKRDTIEDSVFGSKKYYSMILNMPNLTSAGGSWIIRFAELSDSARPGELTAPVAVVKVDPAYPSEAIRNKIEGTVVLYAVIRSDGTVGEVRVLRGVDQQLDANACEALSHWHFRPATKNGAAVDLESVVQIPFAIPNQPAY